MASESTIVPHLTISWFKGGDASIALSSGVFPEGRGLVIGCQGFAPEPVVINGKDTSVAVIGSPVLNERVDPHGLAQAWLACDDDNKFLQELNGQFILLKMDHASKECVVANDRFSSTPLYWADLGDHFIAAFLYFDLFKILRKKPGFQLQKEAMFEYIWLQRLLMDKTYDNFSSYLMPATRMVIRRDGVSSARFWRPDFTKNYDRSEAQAGAEFTDLLKGSIRRQTSDIESTRYGLFLSGGHDSRTVLAAFDDQPECFTVSFSDNLEVDCARQIAKSCNAPFHFIELPENHFSDHLDDLSVICGGMYTIDNGLFVGLHDRIRLSADVVLHGHGLDYMFQGMYLPADFIPLFGRPTFFKKFVSLGDDLPRFFLDHIAFRLKGVDLLELLREDWREPMLDWMLNAAKAVIDDGKDVCQSKNDYWEYFIVHALGRHYSYPNIASKMTGAQQRTPSFDNDLFDYYCSLPPKHRLYAQTLRHALKALRPDLARIPTGNWGIAAGASPAYKTAFLIGRKLLRHLTGRQIFKAPELKDRTWPDRDIYLRTHPEFLQYAIDAVHSEELRSAMPYFDWPKVEKQVETWLSQDSGGGLFLLSLISLHRFFVLSH